MENRLKELKVSAAEKQYFEQVKLPDLGADAKMFIVKVLPSIKVQDGLVLPEANGLFKPVQEVDKSLPKGVVVKAPINSTIKEGDYVVWSTMAHFFKFEIDDLKYEETEGKYISIAEMMILYYINGN